MYNIQVSKGKVKKLAGNFGIPTVYTSKENAKEDLTLLRKQNKKLKIWDRIALVKENTAKRINEKNLNEKSLKNGEVMQILNQLAKEVDPCGFSRVLDVVEKLTGDRNFFETRNYELSTFSI